MSKETSTNKSETQSGKVTNIKEGYWKRFSRIAGNLREVKQELLELQREKKRLMEDMSVSLGEVMPPLVEQINRLEKEKERLLGDASMSYIDREMKGEN